MKMTKNMLNVLKELSQTPNKAGYVHMTTAWALERRGLIDLGNIPDRQRTTGEAFPQYWVSLTKKGKIFCEERFG